jgi:hypothetical protein
MQMFVASAPLKELNKRFGFNGSLRGIVVSVLWRWHLHALQVTLGAFSLSVEKALHAYFLVGKRRNPFVDGPGATDLIEKADTLCSDH